MCSEIIIFLSRLVKNRGCQWPSLHPGIWLSGGVIQASSPHPTSSVPLQRMFSPFVIFPSHFSDWTRYLWAVIYCIFELILCSAIVKHSCGPVPQGDIFFFFTDLLTYLFLPEFPILCLMFSYLFIVEWNIQPISSGNKTSLENDKNKNAFI